MVFDFELFQGADLELTIVLRDNDGLPRNLIGKSFRGHAKMSLQKKLPDIKFTFEASNSDLVNGQFKLKVPSYVSSALDIRIKTKLYYDIEMFDDNFVERVLMGKIDFYPEVTR
jgi:hypothetical protein